MELNNLNLQKVRLKDKESALVVDKVLEKVVLQHVVTTEQSHVQGILRN